MTLPSIETWWPRLGVEARHELLEAPQAPLSGRVREEIRGITGEEVGEDAVLSESDRGFIATQQEAVD